MQTMLLTKVVRYVSMMKKITITPLKVDASIVLGEHGISFARKCCKAGTF